MEIVVKLVVQVNVVVAGEGGGEGILQPILYGDALSDVQTPYPFTY